MSKKKVEPIEETTVSTDPMKDAVEAIKATDGPKATDSLSTPIQTADSPATSEPSATSTPIPEPEPAPVLPDPDGDKIALVKRAAEDGWGTLMARDDLAGFLGKMQDDGAPYDDLDPAVRFGLHALTLGIVNDPHADTLGSVMADNNDRRTVRLLENEIRHALGYSPVHHP